MAKRIGAKLGVNQVLEKKEINEDCDESLVPDAISSYRNTSSECLNGLVSVIIPTFNRKVFLLQALNSILMQTYRPLEVVVVDDGSTDETYQTVEQWYASIAENELFYLVLVRQKNSGAQRARNKGVEFSKGEYVQFFDSDDLLHPNKIEKQILFLHKNPTVDFVYSSAEIFFNNPGDSETIVGCRKSMTIAGHVGANPIKTDLGLYRRELIRKLGAWNESLKIWQEREYNLRMFILGANIAFLPGVLAYYRVHDDEVRTSRGVGSLDVLNSLGEMEKLATNKFTGHAKKEFEEALSKQHFSVFLHSCINKKKDISRIAIRNSLRLANSTKQKFKAGMFFLFSYLIPNTSFRALFCGFLYKKMLGK